MRGTTAGVVVGFVVGTAGSEIGAGDNSAGGVDLGTGSPIGATTGSGVQMSGSFIPPPSSPRRLVLPGADAGNGKGRPNSGFGSAWTVASPAAASPEDFAAGEDAALPEKVVSPGDVVLPEKVVSPGAVALPKTAGSPRDVALLKKAGSLENIASGEPFHAGTPQSTPPGSKGRHTVGRGNQSGRARPRCRRGVDPASKPAHPQRTSVNSSRAQHLMACREILLPCTMRLPNSAAADKLRWRIPVPLAWHPAIVAAELGLPGKRRTCLMRYLVPCVDAIAIATSDSNRQNPIVGIIFLFGTSFPDCAIIYL